MDPKLQVLRGRNERREGRRAVAARVCPVERQSEADSLPGPEVVEFVDTGQTVARHRSDTSCARPLVITRTTSPRPSSARSVYRRFRPLGMPSAVPHFW